MPDFVAEGATFEQARQTLRLKYHRVPAQPQFGPSNLPAGTIFGQQPPAGTDLRKGDPIILQVSDGTAPPSVDGPVTPVPSADVSVTVRVRTAGPFAPGDKLQFTILVTNAGPSPASHVRIVATLLNLAFTETSGACTVFPCEIAALEANSTATIDAVATIRHAGSFDAAVTATPAESDPDGANNSATSGIFTAAAKGTVPATDPAQRGVARDADAAAPMIVTPPIHSRNRWQRLALIIGVSWWPWILAVAAVLACVAAAVVTARKASWRRMVKVSASLARSGDSSVSPLPIRAPSVGLRMQLEPGHAAPIGRVPVIRTEV